MGVSTAPEGWQYRGIARQAIRQTEIAPAAGLDLILPVDTASSGLLNSYFITWFIQCIRFILRTRFNPANHLNSFMSFQYQTVKDVDSGNLLASQPYI